MSTLLQLADSCPLAPGLYRLYQGERVIHVGMAAGAATLRSEIVAHASGEYGAATQSADDVDWEVAPDAFLAYRRFLSVFARATYDASGNESSRAVSHSVSNRLMQAPPAIAPALEESPQILRRA